MVLLHALNTPVPLRDEALCFLIPFHEAGFV